MQALPYPGHGTVLGRGILVPPAGAQRECGNGTQIGSLLPETGWVGLRAPRGRRGVLQEGHRHRSAVQWVELVPGVPCSAFSSIPAPGRASLLPRGCPRPAQHMVFQASG